MTESMNKSGAFSWRRFLGNIAAIGIPVALQNLLTTTGSMVDTVMLASLGENTVGAVGLCASYASLMFSSYWGFLSCGMIFFSQYWGAGDDDGINRAYGLTLAFVAAVVGVFTALALAAPYACMSIYTDSETIRQIGAGVPQDRGGMPIRCRSSRC